MKRISNILFSSVTTIILLVMLIVAMATATFIEDKFDTLTAKLLVYEAKWFELLFLLLIINLIGHIKTYHLLSKKKIGNIIFHLAFVIMILGAGITRYFGIEGNMHIREGESTNIIYTSDPYLLISYTEKTKRYSYSFPFNNRKITENNFHIEIPSVEKGNIAINFSEYVNNAMEIVEDNNENGEKIIELTVASEKGQEILYIEDGKTKLIGNIPIAFNNKENKNSINIFETGNTFKIKSSYDIFETNMKETEKDTIVKDSVYELKKGYIYSVGKLMFVFSNYYRKGIKKVISAKTETGIDAIVLNVTIKNQKYKANVFGGANTNAVFQDLNTDNPNLKFAFGNKPIELPFSLHLNKFVLERYPGSESPSSYASEVTLIDNRKNLKEDRRIFMNKVLDYDQYRFFQSSYDMDEKGTILSVNHDFWGTWITYFGYLLLGIGFLITLVNKNSRFLSLRRNINEVRSKRKSMLLMIAFMFGLNGIAFSQNNIKNPVDASHAEKFSHLITQTYSGRFEPIHSLAYDVMHKISRKDKFHIEGVGNMDAMQVFLDMIENPEFWQTQKIIYIREQSVRDIIGIKEKKASFLDFFDAYFQYKLQKQVSDAFRKKQSEQTTFDKEIIKVDERVNIFYMVMKGSMLKIFPEVGSPNNKWISWDDSTALMPLNNINNAITEDLHLKTINYASIMQAYIEEVHLGMASGDYSKADKIIGYISSIQRQGSNAALLPSDRKINAEIFYNKAQIFIFLRNFYALISVILLLLAFIDNVRSEKNKMIRIAINICSGLLVIAFIYHTLGLALRWYISGHAPWSNGYEALILLAWGALIAGFCFMKQSKITLASTTLLAFFVLMTASHSSYDPQLTNLQPVLKSYWLIIHVATLTISYAFLGLGFILGIINLFLYLFKTKNNHARLDLLILENTYINEMNLIIGIVLATIGTFLGAIWANESWGRYWGWDAKETWALIIIITYALVLHLRMIPRLKGKYIFNVASVFAFSSVLMTFIGVNYYFSKGLHSYGQGDTPAFPLWAWVTIFSLIALIIFAGIKQISLSKMA